MDKSDKIFQLYKEYLFENPKVNEANALEFMIKAYALGYARMLGETTLIKGLNELLLNETLSKREIESDL